MRLIRSARPEIVAQEAQLLQLTHDQHAALWGLFVNRRVLVEGVAGSGKTLLAMEVARTRAAQGARVRLLCFNRHLAAWLQDQLGGGATDGTSGGRVEVDSFHSLAIRLARLASVEFEVPEGEGAGPFWEREAAQLMDQAVHLLRRGPEDPTCDVLVVDEAQDFLPEWWIALEELLEDPDQGAVFAFLDMEQRLRQGGEAPPIALPVRFILTTSCRNTRRIARSAAGILGLPVDLLQSAPEGRAPRLLRAPGQSAQAGLVSAEVRRLLGQEGLSPSQIVLIGPAGRAVGALQGTRDIAGIPITSSAEDWRAGRGLLCTTARAFKGLEADVVVLYDLDRLGGAFSSRDLYVAWTRAKHQLIAIVHGSAAREAVEHALSCSEAP
jgi:hypothetical protein